MPINAKTIQYPFTSADVMTLVEYSGNNPLYIGRANPGTADGTAAWQIKKLTFDANNNITAMEFADGTNDYLKIWSDRAGYSYS